MKDIFVVSIIKGIGKTTGGMLVFGTIASLWYFVSSGQGVQRSKKQVRSRGTHMDPPGTHIDPNEICDVKAVDFKKIFQAL